MLPLGSIFQKHQISCHSYADDTHFYLSLKPGANSTLQKVSECLSDIHCWMSLNLLKLNHDKTDIIIFGKQDSISLIRNNLGPLSANVHPHVKNLVFIFDSTLKLDKQINSVVRGSFFQLRSISKLKNILSSKDLETVIHAFISSRLDYCNSLYLGICHSSLSRLQLVQNAAARLLTGTRKRENITPVLASLHWLPVKHRIDFKVLLFVFKALHGLAPGYISNLLSLHLPTRSLRSSSQMVSSVPRSQLKSRGDRAFSIAARDSGIVFPPS